MGLKTEVREELDADMARQAEKISNNSDSISMVREEVGTNEAHLRDFEAKQEEQENKSCRVRRKHRLVALLMFSIQAIVHI